MLNRRSVSDSMRLPVLGLVLSAALVACGGVGGSDDGDDATGFASSDTAPAGESETGAQSVVCTRNADCSGEQRCEEGQCVSRRECANDIDCPRSEFCAVDLGVCVECIDDLDCSGDQICRKFICRESVSGTVDDGNADDSAGDVSGADPTTGTTDAGIGHGAATTDGTADGGAADGGGGPTGADSTETSDPEATTAATEGTGPGESAEAGGDGTEATTGGADSDAGVDGTDSATDTGGGTTGESDACVTPGTFCQSVQGNDLCLKIGPALTAGAVVCDVGPCEPGYAKFNVWAAGTTTCYCLEVCSRACVDSGDCAVGRVCTSGLCEPSCQPDCTGRQCGGDGCGGSCGTCGGSQTCSAGQCVSNACDDSAVGCRRDADCCAQSVCMGSAGGILPGACRKQCTSIDRTCPDGQTCQFWGQPVLGPVRCCAASDPCY